MKRPIKMLSLFLVLVISLSSLSVTAFAEENNNITAKIQENIELSDALRIGSGRLMDFPGIVIDPIYRSDIGINPFAFKTKTQNAYIDSGNVNITANKVTTLLKESAEDNMLDSLDKDWYGGIYYVGNEIHIIAVENNQKNIQSHLRMFKSNTSVNTFVVDNPTAVKSSTVVYSMNQLESAKEDLLLDSENLGIVGVGFNGKENALAIYIDDYDNVTNSQKDSIIEKSLVKNIIFRDAAVLGFNEGAQDEVVEEELSNSQNDPTARLTILGGNMLSTSSKEWSTLTTSAVYSYGNPDQMNGFLTCGHGWAVGNSVYYAGVNIGKVRIVERSGSVDFSFIESSYRSNGKMNGGAILNARRSPSTGMSVKSYGGKSGIKTGSVLDVNISGMWDNIEFTNLFSTNIATKVGDSGSAFTYNGNVLVGVMKGGLRGFDKSVGVDINKIYAYDVQPST